MLPEQITMLEFLNQLDTLELPALETPQIYTDRSILKLFLYALVRRMTSFKLLAKILLEKPELRQVCNLKTAPHRTTLSRRFKSLPQPLVNAMPWKGHVLFTDFNSGLWAAKLEPKAKPVTP